MALVGAGQALHGFCIACFWAAGFLYVDRVAGAGLRGSMQTFFGTFVFGLGMLLGGLGSGITVRLLGAEVERATGADWAALWLAPAGVAVVALVGLLVLFPRPLATGAAAAQVAQAARGETAIIERGGSNDGEGTEAAHRLPGGPGP
jgi:MFS family permease